MRAGKVVNVRVSPENCMGVYDMLKVAGINPANINFNSGMSRVFDMMMEGMRRDGIIPKRDGFEYLPIMEGFLNSGKAVMPGYTKMPKVEDIKIPNTAGVPDVMNADQRRAASRFKELCQKKEHAPDSWTAEDEQEMDSVYKQMG